MNRRTSVATAATTLLLAVLLAGAALGQRELTQVTGDLYRFQNNFHFSVVYVTPDGIVVTDPINAEAASWLRQELETRFDLPIRYLVYSHDHADHSSGGEVFAEAGAVVIGHDNARAAILRESRPTAVPDLTFRDRMTIELGGKRIELLWVGRNHSDNSVVLHFPDERVIFAVDFIPTARTLPFQNLNDSYFPDWIESLAAVEQLDFDVLVPGHGPIGDKSDVTNMRGYLQDLFDAVSEQVEAGSSLEETVEAVTLEQYSDWGQYEAWRALNIEGVYRGLQGE